MNSIQDDRAAGLRPGQLCEQVICGPDPVRQHVSALLDAIKALRLAMQLEEQASKLTAARNGPSDDCK